MRLSHLIALLLFAVGRAFGAESDVAQMRAFARAPAMGKVTLSPDGAWLAYVSQSGDRQFVKLRQLASGAERQTLDLIVRRERIRWCDWASADQLLCGTVQPLRRPDRISETTRLYIIDTRGSRVRELTSRLPDVVRDQIVDLRAGRPGHVLIQHDPVGHGYPEVSELDLATGGLRRLVASRPPIRSWMSDGRGTVRLGISHAGPAATLYTLQDGEWMPWLKQSLHDPDAVGPLAFGDATDRLYVLKHHEGRTALFSMSTRDASLQLLFAHPQYDVAGPPILDPGNRRLLGIRYVADRDEQRIFDAATARLQIELDEQLPGRVNLIAGMSVDGRRRLVRSSNDTDPPSWYLQDLDARTVALLGHEYPELEGRELASMQPATYQARDGQVIPAYLTTPAGHDGGPLPAIVLPHGGPETRTAQAFDPLVQFLAAQGYLVLQMNFRGSFGYGAGFAAAGIGHWGSVIHNDITDGARWLVDQELADPSRMCIVGESFGGYAALLGATRESQWYACAASFAGISDLLALSQYAQRLQSAEVWNERLGTDSQALWQMSPITKVKSIESPVLLMHGRLDPVVPVSQSRRFARELRAEDKSHRYIERVECDHELTVESCRVEFFAELQHFLQSVLKP